MNTLEAISLRHTVRKFQKKPLDSEVVEKLNARITENNQKYGLGRMNRRQGSFSVTRESMSLFMPKLLGLIPGGLGEHIAARL